MAAIEEYIQVENHPLSPHETKVGASHLLNAPLRRHASNILYASVR